MATRTTKPIRAPRKKVTKKKAVRKTTPKPKPDVEPSPPLIDDEGLVPHWSSVEPDLVRAGAVKSQGDEFNDYFDSRVAFHSADPLDLLFVLATESHDAKIRLDAARELLAYRHAKLKPSASLLDPAPSQPEGTILHKIIREVVDVKETGKD
jgi:hypothetical protein